ncbi:MAG: ATP-binding protein [Micrococcales bacterium]|nr:ATP-binding protein [Micrococcales bacterium]
MTTRKRATSKTAAKSQTPERVPIRVGIQNTARELVFESSEPEAVEAALTAGWSEGELVTITDAQGAKLLIPTDKVAYVEVGAPAKRRVGFGAS